MSDQSMTFEAGTRVWCHALNWIWWPGKIVDLEDTPEEFQEYISEKKKTYIAIVLFETDKTHEPIINKNKLMLYDCPKKMEFLEKGYGLYEKQLKGHSIKGNFKMNTFLEDVKLAEEATGGNVHIFEQFVKKNQFVPPKLNINALFVSSKDKTKKRKSIATTLSPPIKRAEKSQTGLNNYESRILAMGMSRTPTQGLFYCHGVCGTKGCSYKSSNSDLFRMHTKNPENKNKVNKTLTPKVKQSEVKYQASSSSHKKQTQTKKSKLLGGNKKRLQDAILKDWEEDSNDNLGESFKIESTVEAKTSEGSSSVKSTSNKIFDFDDDDNNVSIENVNLRHQKSTNSLLDNSGSTLNRINNLEESLSKIPVTSNSNSIKSKLSNDSDQNLILSDLEATNAKTEESESNVINKKIMEDPIIANMSTVTDEVDPAKCGRFKLFPLDTSSTPDWTKDKKWDTLERSQYNEAVKKALITSFGELPDLSNMKLENVLMPVIPHPSELILLNNEFEIDILSNEPKPASEPNHRTILIPVDTSVSDNKICSDEELLKSPFFQNIFKKIELNETDDISIEFPEGSILLPKE